MTENSVIILAADNAILSKRLKLEAVLPLSQLDQSNAIFEQTAQGLKLHLMLDSEIQQLMFDLVQGEVASRAIKASKSNETIAKAIGCKPHFRPRLLDATAGMGRDAFIMAALGCQVVMQERNLAIFLLLQDALARFNQSSLATSLKFPIELLFQDFFPRQQAVHKFDLIYLDPMFPERKKSALVKKEMRLFKRLVGDDDDADELLLKSLASGVKRVVVKRPKGAPCLADKKPSHEIKAKKFRYDVYLNELGSIGLK
ncbi:MAG: class I SAM-dependent methyltransferase [Enterobacterales bacterium]|nr:class I SAM-dependent methyltransferase [Enterobacterales bacterium]